MKREPAVDLTVPMLEVVDLDQYYGGSHILRHCAFEARAGEVTVVLGRNGVGKTTLLKSVMGVIPIATGRIALDGVAVTRDTPYQRVRKGMGYVPQGREIFGRLTVQENLAMGLAYKPGGTPVPPELFELFPVLATMRHRRGGDLSGGQQQQLAIARAIAAGPKVLILDEPTEGIQPSIIKDIGRVIRMLADRGLPIAGRRQPMAIVLVEQYYDFAAELADQYLVMERGEIVRRGRGKDMAADGVRQMMSI
jgi:urea transport system ATP-binding protein